jgi:hypothetical protein
MTVTLGRTRPIGRSWPVLAALVALAVALSPVGSGPGRASGGGGDDPESAVRGLLATLTAGRYDALPDALCTAERDALARRLDLRAILADVPPTALPDFAGLVEVSIEGPTATLLEWSEDVAVVHLAGHLEVTVDDEAIGRAVSGLRLGPTGPLDEPVRQALLLESIRDGLARLARDVELDADLDVVREGGRWRVCSDLGWGLEVLAVSEVCALVTPAELRILAPIAFATRQPEGDGCTIGEDPGSPGHSTVNLRIEDGDLSLIEETFPDGQSLTIGGLPAYLTESVVRVDLGGRLLAIQATLIDAPAGVDASRLAQAVAELVVPRIVG